MLFGADTKFDSGTGWPSFTEPAVAEAVELRPDNSLFMRRTEVICRPAAGISATCSTTAPGPRASATASTPRHCQFETLRAEQAPRSPSASAMIMFEQSRRLSEPLRWGRREKTIVAVVVSCLVLAVIGLVAFGLTSGAPARAGCINVTFASTLGAANVHECGARARDRARRRPASAGTRRRN